MAAGLLVVEPVQAHIRLLEFLRTVGERWCGVCLGCHHDAHVRREYLTVSPFDPLRGHSEYSWHGVDVWMMSVKGIIPHCKSLITISRYGLRSIPSCCSPCIWIPPIPSRSDPLPLLRAPGSFWEENISLCSKLVFLVLLKKPFYFFIGLNDIRGKILRNYCFPKTGCFLS